MNFISETFNFLFPKFCLNCNIIISDEQNLICESCIHTLPYTHWGFNTNNYIYTKLNPFIAIENATSLLRFHKENATQELLHQLKYKGQQKLGALFAEILSPLINENKNNKPNCIVPIPIHLKKLKIRGYNQLDSFGNTLSSHLQIPYLPTVLKRKIHQKSQTFKNRIERLKSIKNTYELNNTENIKNHILLIDDVCTTGATLIYCTTLLQSIPRTKISIATITTVF